MFNFFSSFKTDVKTFIANAEARFKALEDKVESLVGIQTAEAEVEAPAVNPTPVTAPIAGTDSGTSSSEPTA